MIKILFFIDTLTGGGAEKVLRTLVNNMDQSKFDITVHTVEGEDPTNHLAPGIRYRAINRCKTAWGKKLFSYWYRLCAQLKWLYPLYIRDDYDIEVAYLECGPTKIIAGSTNQQAKKIAWVHCDLQKRPELAAQAEKLKRYYQRYDKIVCVAESVRESYVQLMGNTPEAVVLYNVNDETDILTKAQKERVRKENLPTFVCVGRLSYEKGVDRLLDASANLRTEGYEFRLWIVGDGDQRAALQKKTEQNGLENTVHFWGFQENPYPYMQAADCVICPSRYEGFSTVVTEALILGKPVVTTPCSGMRELLGESEYGLITDDSVQGLCEGMKQFLANSEHRERYAEAALKRGTAFSRKNAVEKTEHFFSELIKK